MRDKKMGERYREMPDGAVPCEADIDGAARTDLGPAAKHPVQERLLLKILEALDGHVEPERFGDVVADVAAAAWDQFRISTGRRLPPIRQKAKAQRQRDVLSLRRRGRTQKEIAKALGVSISTVGRVLHAVREATTPAYHPDPPSAPETCAPPPLLPHRQDKRPT